MQQQLALIGRPIASGDAAALSGLRTLLLHSDRSADRHIDLPRQLLESAPFGPTISVSGFSGDHEAMGLPADVLIVQVTKPSLARTRGSRGLHRKPPNSGLRLTSAERPVLDPSRWRQATRVVYQMHHSRLRGQGRSL